MPFPNPIPPSRLTAAERLAEIADLLAAGVIRLRARKSSLLSGQNGESFLDFMPPERGHEPRRRRRS
jgi:hypothetical protein